MVKELIETYDLYIRLLIGELEELVPLGTSHGWKSTRHETGRLYREKIKALKSAVLAQQHLTKQDSEPTEICPKCGAKTKTTSLFKVCRYCGYITPR